MKKIVIISIDAISIAIIATFINTIFNTSGITTVLVGGVVSLIFSA